MTLLQDRTIEYLLELAKWDSGREVCGLVLQNGSVHPILNVARHPQRTFEMDPQQQLQAIQAFGKQIIGIYHSHPSQLDYPSHIDLSGWPRNGWRYWIVTHTHVSEWELVHDSEKFIGIPACVSHQYPEFSSQLASEVLEGSG